MDPNDKGAGNAKPDKKLTAAEAAKFVRRTVQVLDDAGKPTGKTEERPVSEKEVFSFKEYGDKVVVVTIDGQKLTGAKK